MIKNTFVIILFFIVISCKKNLYYTESNSTLSNASHYNVNTKFLLGTNRKSGEIQLFEKKAHDPYLIYGGDMLIHESEIDIIKEYSEYNLDYKEIDLLTKNYSMHKSGKTNARVPTNWIGIQEGCIPWNTTIKLKIVSNLHGFRLTDRQIQDLQRAVVAWVTASKGSLNFSISYPCDAIPSEEPSVLVQPRLAQKPDGSWVWQNGSQATVGQPIDGQQGLLRLGNSAVYEDILHELGHTLGFIHEHQRKIAVENFIEPDERAKGIIHNLVSNEAQYQAFIRSTYNIIPSYNDNKMPFDIKSIMIYPSYGHRSTTYRSTLIENNAPLYRYRPDHSIIHDVNYLSMQDSLKVQTVYPKYN